MEITANSIQFQAANHQPVVPQAANEGSCLLRKVGCIALSSFMAFGAGYYAVNKANFRASADHQGQSLLASFVLSSLAAVGTVCALHVLLAGHQKASKPVAADVDASPVASPPVARLNAHAAQLAEVAVSSEQKSSGTAPNAASMAAQDPVLASEISIYDAYENTLFDIATSLLRRENAANIRAFGNNSTSQSIELCSQAEELSAMRTTTGDFEGRLNLIKKMEKSIGLVAQDKGQKEATACQMQAAKTIFKAQLAKIAADAIPDNIGPRAPGLRDAFLRDDCPRGAVDDSSLCLHQSAEEKGAADDSMTPTRKLWEAFENEASATPTSAPATSNSTSVVLYDNW